MPEFTLPDGTAIHYQIDGTEGRPWLVFSNSLGTNLNMWDDQVAEFGEDFRILRYDSRGHGQSGAPEGAYSIGMLGSDALALMDHVGIDKAYWCGLSKGGMVGMWLGTNHGDRFHRMAYCNTAAHMPTAEMWAERASVARNQGMQALQEAIIGRWFTPAFISEAPDRVDLVRKQILSTPGNGYAGCCDAIGDMNQRESIKAIRLPVLVIAGADDPATPPEKGQDIANAINGARLVVLDNAAHLSNIEQTAAFNTALRSFLTGD